MLRRAEMNSQTSDWMSFKTRPDASDGGNCFELRNLAANLLEAQEQERRRVSRELHDELGQRLALLEIQIEEMRRRIGSDGRFDSELSALRSRVGEIAEDVHRICYRLHPAILENLGLLSAIRSHCQEYSASNGIKIRFSHCEVPSHLPSNVTLCIYRIVQEALRNVAKHSRSARAMVILRGVRHGLQVVIKDSGRGFVLDQARAKGGLGLISLTERVRLAGGNCAVRSAPGQGTRIQAWIPLSMEACAG